MGASEFQVISKGSTAKEAFNSAIDDARWAFGNSGYTGSIAEKRSFALIPCPSTNTTTKQVLMYSEELMDDDDPRISDKWGPAGCIKLPDKEDSYLFFGWASS